MVGPQSFHGDPAYVASKGGLEALMRALAVELGPKGIAANAIAPGFFRTEGNAPFFDQPGPHGQSEYMYYSFVVLTTLGFGDLSPSVGLPQALTGTEALLGQVFLVTLVARLVTLWVRQSEGEEN